MTNRADDELTRLAGGRRFASVLADPPWQFVNRTGKMAPEHKRLNRYQTLTTDAICALPVTSVLADKAHLYLWVPNALLPDGLRVMAAWGFAYKTNIVWEKIRKDGGPDGRGVGFYFRNVTELLLFGTRGRNNRTLGPGRRQVNFIATRKREHSRKPDEQYALIEACSPGPYLELFARGRRQGWDGWGVQATESYARPGTPTPIIPGPRPDWSKAGLRNRTHGCMPLASSDAPEAEGWPCRGAPRADHVSAAAALPCRAPEPRPVAS